MRRDIIVIGASAGGVEALRTLANKLPTELKATLFVVLHISPSHKSLLPEILNASGPSPTIHPEHKQSIETGRIYVAPPDHHMLVEADHVVLWRGPKENNQGRQSTRYSARQRKAISAGHRSPADRMQGRW